MNGNSDNREAVVLLHGLWMTRGIMAPLGRRLAVASPERKIHLFGYPSMRADLGQNVGALASFVDGLDADVVHLVGHSLGGVVIMHLLNRQPPSHPGRVVCLGSPLRGSATGARMQELPGINQFVGRTLSQVLEQSLPDWSGDREVGVIAGALGVGLGQLLYHPNEPSDGTVCVSETRLPGISDHIVLGLSHTGLLLSPRAVTQVDYFLSHGQFLHDDSD
jgi:pimeloyl-ACP methyl ester carboxylesterase